MKDKVSSPLPLLRSSWFIKRNLQVTRKVQNSLIINRLGEEDTQVSLYVSFSVFILLFIKSVLTLSTNTMKISALILYTSF